MNSEPANDPFDIDSAEQADFENSDPKSPLDRRRILIISICLTVLIGISIATFSRINGISVDKASRAYRQMFNAGRNFAKYSVANGTAEKQCSSVLNKGIIYTYAGPRYIGYQTQQFQSFLSTRDGWQGCLDGFGR